MGGFFTSAFLASTVEWEVNLAELLQGSNAYVGLTAATEPGHNGYVKHEVFSWQFRTVPEPEEYGPALDW